MINATSVTNLQQQFDHLIKQNFATVAVYGEVSNCILARSGHCYFTLKDDNAEIKCVFFKHHRRTMPPPTNGDAIQLVGNPGIYLERGSLQLNVKYYMPHGIGELQKKYAQLKSDLTERGFFCPTRKQQTPYLVEKIGIITSPQADALIDIVQAFQRRSPWIELNIHVCMVQGSSAAQTIADALANADTCNYDAIIISRGGGSLEDLWAFNESIVIEQIAKSTTPIITGIGHARDESLADLAADQVAATPTAAAELLSTPTSEIAAKINGSINNIKNNLINACKLTEYRHTNIVRSLRHPAEIINNWQQSLTKISDRIRQNSKQQLQKKQHHYNVAIAKLAATNLQPATQSIILTITQNQRQLAHTISQQHSRLQLLTAKLYGNITRHDPNLPLKKGYAYLLDLNGKIIRTPKIGQTITVHNQHQISSCKVLEVKENQAENLE